MKTKRIIIYGRVSTAEQRHDSQIAEVQDYCARRCGDNVVDPSSRKAVTFSSARTPKRLPSSRCASAIQIVRRLESIAETQPCGCSLTSCWSATFASRGACDLTWQYSVHNRSGPRGVKPFMRFDPSEAVAHFRSPIFDCRSTIQPREPHACAF
jgi:hypothetical protein